MRALLQALRNLGLDRAQRRSFVQGIATVYYFPTGSAPAIAMVQWSEDKLRNGIIDINDVGGGLEDLIRFRSRSFEVAAALGVSSVELFGAALINAKLEALLLRHGFTPAMEAVPEELGGGTIEIVTRAFPVT